MHLRLFVLPYALLYLLVLRLKYSVNFSYIYYADHRVRYDTLREYLTCSQKTEETGELFGTIAAF